MAYDEGLAQRVREALADQPRLTAKRMFGGIAFMLGGNMCAGIIGAELMVRVGPEAYAELVGQAHARAMDFTGKPMKGMVMVDEEGVDQDDDLRRWVGHGAAYAGSLPTK